MTTPLQPSLEERLQRHPHLRQRFQQILDIIEAPSGHVDTADEAEQRAIEELRRLGQEVLHQWAADKEAQKTTELETKGQQFTRSAKKKLCWYTTFGAITVTERTYVVNGQVVRPFAATAGVTSRGCSTVLERRLTDFGADVPFAKVAAKMTEHYGTALPQHLGRTITEKHAQRMVATAVLAQELPDHGSAVIIGETDGSMVPIVTIVPRNSPDEPADGRKRRRLGWNEARLSLAHAHGSVTPIFNATMGGPDATGDQLLDCVIRAGAGAHSTIHCVGDGAPWIADQVDRVCAENGTYLIDFPHLCDYLAAAAPRCCPGESAPWLEQQKELMLTGRMAEVLAHLAPYREPPAIPDHEAPVRCCYRYLINRPGQFEYQQALAADLPIGSGEIESAHRYIIQDRLKLAGAWWTPTNANAMLALRTLRANGGWEDYWGQQFKHAA